MDNNNFHIPHLDDQNAEILKNKGRRSRMLLESEILLMQERTVSASQAARRLRVSYPTYKKYCKLYNIFKTRKELDNAYTKEKIIAKQNPNTGKYSIDKLLNNECSNYPLHRLKDKLIRSGLKVAECEQCGFKERRVTDGKIPLLVNFDDGNINNKTIENIKLFCYNCTFICGRGNLSTTNSKTIDHAFDPDVLQGSKEKLNKPSF